MRVKEQTAELIRTNERLSEGMEDRKQAASSLREALRIIKQLRDQLDEENLYLKEEINKLCKIADAKKEKQNCGF